MEERNSKRDCNVLNEIVSTDNLLVMDLLIDYLGKRFDELDERRRIEEIKEKKMVSSDVVKEKKVNVSKNPLEQYYNELNSSFKEENFKSFETPGKSQTVMDFIKKFRLKELQILKLRSQLYTIRTTALSIARRRGELKVDVEGGCSEYAGSAESENVKASKQQSNEKHNKEYKG